MAIKIRLSVDFPALVSKFNSDNNAESCCNFSIGAQNRGVRGIGGICATSVLSRFLWPGRSVEVKVKFDASRAWIKEALAF